MSDFDAVVSRAVDAIRKGIATIEVKEDPAVVSNRDFDGGEGRQVVVPIGEQSVTVTISWREVPPVSTNEGGRDGR